MPQILIPGKALYHFTAAHLIEAIKHEGLWRGRLPWQRDPDGVPCMIRSMHETKFSATALAELDAMEQDEYLANLARKKLELGNKRAHVNGRPLIVRKWRRPGFQWLTSNPEWVQPFALLGTAPFPKNAHRIEVRVPTIYHGRLHRWSKFCERGSPDCAEEINTREVDWENWWVYYGPIDPTWLVNIDRNPGQQITPELDGPDAKLL